MNKTYHSKRNDFSEAHYKLPRNYNMFDIDVMFGEWLELEPSVSQKENATFIEYRTLRYDKDQSRFNTDRIKHVAIFELKYKGTESLKKKMNLMPGEPLWAIFLTAKILNCRFFLVVATEGKSPFYFIEYCTKTNERIKDYKTLQFNYKNDDPKMIKEFWNSELNIS